MEKIKNLETNLRERINSAKTKEEIEKIRIELLGRKRGEITLLLKKIPELPLKDRPRVGNLLNKLKKEAEQLLQKKEESFKKGEKVLKKIDITLPVQLPLQIQVQ